MRKNEDCPSREDSCLLGEGIVRLHNSKCKKGGRMPKEKTALHI